jgi:hypothetical protein
MTARLLVWCLDMFQPIEWITTIRKNAARKGHPAAPFIIRRPLTEQSSSRVPEEPQECGPGYYLVGKLDQCITKLTGELSAKVWRVDYKYIATTYS